MDAPPPPPEADALPGWPHPRAAARVLGHDAALAELAEFGQGRGHHAWLITGETGVGRATLAHAAARALLGDTPRALGQLAAGSHPGIFVLRRPWDASASRFRQAIAVDDVRRMRHFAQATAAAQARVVIVDTADELGPGSANALLKTLEEPPPATLFLVIAASAGAVLPTIRSRCLQLPLEPLGRADFAAALGAAAHAAGRAVPDDLPALFSTAGGAPGAAARLADGPGLAIARRVARFLDAPDRDPLAGHEIAALVPAQAGAAGYDFALDAMLAGLAARACAAPGLAQFPALWEKLTAARGQADRLNLDRTALIVLATAEIAAATAKPGPPA